MKNDSKTNQGIKGPLIYIQQPDFHIEKTNMQEIYISKEETELKQAVKPNSELNEEAQTAHENKNNSPKEEVENTSDSISQTGTYEFKPVKPFRMMELDEKIAYLAKFSGGKAPFPCEFMTNELRVKGIIHRIHGPLIEIKTFTDDFFVVHQNDLLEIKMIGIM
ncbi:CotO family spore coat protein [Falsibacillus pallidus]|uniref:Spore coat protein CotO n=1 Tax=Falsibacillus pallidus TaxID=493781 RepID=A0A370GVN8_9BACI|nr:CotO family spore coat protein [Falsibacillus pallidus]RDI47745.1 spore coat protein CotO [Falsibacillus pallidus]